MTDKSGREEAAGPPPGTGLRRKRRRWPWILAAAALALIVAFALLPWGLSLGPGRRLVLGVINRRLPGSLAVDSWSLGWLSGFDAHGLEFKDPQGNSLLKAEAARIPASFFMLWGRQKNLGEVQVNSPHVTLILPEERTESIPETIARWMREAERFRLPFDLEGGVTITNGTVSVRRGGGPAATLSAVNGRASIESLNAPIRCSFEGVLGEGGGRLKLSGSVKALKAGAFDPDALAADAELSAEGLELAEVAPLARQMGAPVDFSGRLGGQVSANVAGVRQVTVSGRVALNSLRLSGGPLGEDRPEFEEVSVEFNAGLDGREVQVKEFRLESPVGHAELSGILPFQAPATWSRARLQADLALDIAALGARMPHVLRLQKGLVISEGTCGLQAAVSGSDQGIQVEANVRLENLAALRGGERIAAGAPVVIEVKGALTGQGPRLDTAKLESAFVTAQASGTMESFSMRAATDLAALTREASKFLDLGGLSFSGKATARLSTSPAGPEAPADRRLAAGIDVKGLRIGGLAGGPVAVDSLAAEASALAAFDGGRLPKEARQVRVEARGDAGTARLTVERASTPGSLAGLELAGLLLDADVSLARLVQLGRGMGLVPEGLSLNGEARTALTGSLAAGVLTVDHFDAGVQDFALSRHGRSLALPTVSLAGGLSADLASHSLRIKSAELTALPCKIAVADAVIPDWTRPARGTEGSFTADVDLAQALTAIKGALAVPEGLDAAGRAAFSGRLGPLSVAAPEGARQLSARAEVRDWQVRRPAGEPVAGEFLEVECAAAVTPQSEGLPFALDNLSVKVRSPFGTSDVAAHKARGGPALADLEITGLAVDGAASLGTLARLARQLGFAPTDLAVEGDARMTCGGSMAGGIARIEKLDLVAQGLVLKAGARELRQPEVRLSIAGEARLAQRALALESVRLTASPGTVQASGVRVADWTGLPNGVSATLEGDLDLSALAHSLRDVALLPGDAEVSGRLKLECVLTSAGGIQQGDLRATAEPVQVGRSGSWQLAEDRVRMAGKVSVDRARRIAKMEGLRVSSALLELSADGELTDWTGARKLSLQGKVTPDLQRVSALVRSFTGRDLALEGKEERPFKIATELGHPDWQTILDRTTAEAGLNVGHVGRPGLEAEALALDVTTEKGGVRLALTGKVSGGQLSFRPLLAVSGGKPALTLPPEASTVLTGVQLTDELANSVVGRAMPLFRRPVKARGAVDVEVSDLRVPLEPGFARKATANGTLGFRGVSLASSGLLKEVLDTVHLGGRSVTVPDQQVGLGLSDGRFRQDRMTFHVGHYAMLASGSVGLDKSLEMLVELPLTREVVGSDSAYELLKDETLKVRIAGTLDDPQIDRGTVQENLRSLLQSAAFGLLRRSLE